MLIVALAATALALAVSSAAAARRGNSRAAASRAAAHLVAKRPAFLHASRADAFVRHAVLTTPQGLRFVPYDRTYKGLPVIGGDFVIVARRGRVLWKATAQRSTINVSKRPLISAELAARIARRQLTIVDAVRFTRLVVQAQLGAPRLAYETLVVGRRVARPSRLHVFVDARTGAVLNTMDEVKDGDGTGWINGPTPFHIDTSGSGSSFTMTDPLRSGIKCRDYANNTVFSGIDDVWGNGVGTSKETGCADALFSVQHEWDMLAAWLGRSGIDGSGGGFPIDVGLNDLNAFWDGVRVAIGHNAAGKWISALDVVGHEFGHAIDSNTPGGDSANGVSESTGDIFGALSEWYTNESAPYDTPDFQVGEEIDLEGGGPIRFMYDPSLVGDPNCYSSSIPGAETHAAAGPFNHWFYLVAEGTSPSDGQPTSPTCNSSTISGIGIQKAGTVFYTAMLAKTSGMTYLKYRTATLNAAKSAFSGCGVFNVVKAAWDAVSVPAQAGDPTCVAATLTTQASPGVTIGGQVADSATVTGRTAPLAGATITFNLYGPDDATCATTPVHTFTANQPVSDGSVPSDSFTPALAGTYRWRAFYSGDANNVPVNGACNDANESVVVSKASPTISAAASGTIALGGQVSDTANVAGRVQAQTGATVTFRLYGPADPTCTATPVFEFVKNQPIANGNLSSDPYTPNQAGTYHWRAFYSGDANNNAVSGACGAAGQSVTVAKAATTIATTASGPVTIGGQVSDSATVGGRVNPEATGTVTFRLYGPADAGCAATPVFEFVKNQPIGNGAVSSDPFPTTQAGTYHWRAFYSGDANNNAVSGPCGAPNETVTVGKASPTIASTASPGITIGDGQLTDSATVSGRVDPKAGATVTFDLYGPDDATCSGSPVSESVIDQPTTDGAVESDAFTPDEAGVYRWVATYGGDASNNDIAGACDDATETVTVARATPTIAATASPLVVVAGGQVADVATVSDRVGPQAGGTVIFDLYGPNDATCSGSPAFEASIDQPVADGPVVSGLATLTQPGIYRWIARYGGDVNNAPAEGACNATGQYNAVIRAPALPGIGSSLADTTISLKLAGKVKQRPLHKSRGIRVKVSCPDEACVVLTDARLIVPAVQKGKKARRYRLKRAPVLLAAGRVKTIRLKLSRTLRHRVARRLERPSTRLHVRARIKVTAVDAAHNRASSKMTVKLRG
jgi:Zn-dependent metalloprotease